MKNGRRTLISCIHPISGIHPAAVMELTGEIEPTNAELARLILAGHVRSDPDYLDRHIEAYWCDLTEAELRAFLAATDPRPQRRRTQPKRRG